MGRLVAALRRRLRPQRAAPPATVPGLGSGEETAVAAAQRPAAAEPERAVTADEPAAAADAAAEPVGESRRSDFDAQFDAARDRLRSTIAPPADDDPG